MPIQSLNNRIADFERAQTHRETYIAVIKSILKTPAEVRNFARLLDIPPSHLSKFLNPVSTQTPGRDLAAKIAESVPLSHQDRQILLHHLRMANPHNAETLKARPSHNEQLTYEQSRDVMLWISNAEYQALYTTDNEQARRAYRMIIKFGDWALERITPSHSPYHHTKITTSLNLAANILNKHIGAIWYAKASIAAAKQLEYWPEQDRPHQLECLINALNAASVTYQILGMPVEALEYVSQSKHLVIDKVPAADQKRLIPKVVQEELNILAITPKASLDAIERSHEWGLNALYSSTLGRSSTDVMATMINRNVVASYIQHGSRRSLSKAAQIIADTYRDECLSQHGPLIHTLHLRTAADLSRKQGDMVSYGAWMHRALKLAQDAGLDHQISEIRQEMPND